MMKKNQKLETGNYLLSLFLPNMVLKNKTAILYQVKLKDSVVKKLNLKSFRSIICSIYELDHKNRWQLFSNFSKCLINLKIEEKPLKDFAGLDKIDDYTKKAIMNFGYFLSIGNMDEAYKSVKLIQNPLVWENMAQMCVKTKRIDVAETCLGNMRFARGAKLVRESKTDDAIEPQLAMLAIQLGMKDEAKKLYEECKRYDLINNMYQANAEWDRALLVAETNDRISLKATYFKMAKQFEISKDFDRAIEYYEKSGTHHREVPRMLMNAKEIQTLEEYVVSNSDKGLKKWWAQYLESQGRIEEAIKYYKESEDYSDLVNIFDETLML
jgi:intraflagellar transport protein 140